MQTTTIRVTLPEHPEHPGVEQWAELRAASLMRAGDAKAIRKAVRLHFAKDGDHWDGTFSVGDDDDRTDALLARVIVAWSYDLPLPVADPASLDEIPVDAWDALREAVKPHREALDFTRKPTEQQQPDGSSSSRTDSEASTSPDTSPTTT
ncbi:hypothetical protein [Actinomadura sp. KC216]|uniref:hypothetical protein n=1 Tax=Actinomadura sp. KC216 TaxID=2530370 RepID=UPI001405565C|nr:hypothetical protein [Actinomadura sp. KC216]